MAGVALRTLKRLETAPVSRQEESLVRIRDALSRRGVTLVFHGANAVGISVDEDQAGPASFGTDLADP